MSVKKWYYISKAVTLILAGVIAFDPALAYKKDGKCGLEITYSSGKSEEVDYPCNKSYFSLSSRNIKEVKGFGSFKNISSINLSQNKINDLGDINISGLSSLSSLDLSQNRIEELSDLKHLPQLYSLNLGRNKIEEITSVGKFRKLRYLYLNGNKIKKIKGLSKLENLYYLNLGGNSIKKIEGLAGLKKLKTLMLGNNKITQFGGLSKLTRLEKLDLTGNKIKSPKKKKKKKKKGKKKGGKDEHLSKKFKGIEMLKRLQYFDADGHKFGEFEFTDFLITGDTHIYARPNADSKKLTKVKKGDLITVTGRFWKKQSAENHKGYWIKVGYKHLKGYAFSPFLANRRAFILGQFVGTWRCGDRDIWFARIPQSNSRLKLVKEKAKGTQMSQSSTVYLNYSDLQMTEGNNRWKIAGNKLIWSQDGLAIHQCKKK